MTELLHLIGFVLAHACWIEAELPKGESLAPFAIVERTVGTRELRVFEAATQDEAISKGKAFLAKPPENAVRIAFVMDGLLRAPDGTATDVLSITGWERSRPELIISQTYRLDPRLGFKLIGDPFVALGEIEDEARSIAEIRKGVSDHPRAGALWTGWGGRPVIH